MLAFFQNILVILVNLYFFSVLRWLMKSSLTNKKKKLENNIFINATCKTRHTLF